MLTSCLHGGKTPWKDRKNLGDKLFWKVLLQHIALWQNRSQQAQLNEKFFLMKVNGQNQAFHLNTFVKAFSQDFRELKYTGNSNGLLYIIKACSIKSKNNAGQKGPSEVFSPNLCSKQAHFNQVDQSCPVKLWVSQWMEFSQCL